MRRSKGKKQGVQILRKISELATLQGVAGKQGRALVESDISILKNAAVVVQGEEIVWLGSDSRLPKQYLKSVEVNCRGEVIIPAFVECHTHTVFAGTRAAEFEMRRRGKTYQEITRAGGGIHSTVRATRQAPLSELTALTIERMQRFLQQGVTTIEFKSGYGLDLKTEIKMLRAGQAAASQLQIRAVATFLGAHAIPEEFHSEAEWIDLLIANLPSLKKWAQRIDIFIEQGFFSLSQAKKYLLAAKGLGFDLVLHADQISRTGATELGCLNAARSVDHVIQIGEKDIELLGNSPTVAVLLPLADLYMQCAFPPARKIIDAGGRVALATDFNPGTAPSQDLALTGLLARLEMKMQGFEVLAAYTYNAAQALNLHHKLGYLGEGCYADLLVLNSEIDELFYQAGHMPINKIMTKGRWIEKKSLRSFSGSA